MVQSLSLSLSGQVDAVHWSVHGQCDLQFFPLHDESGIPLMFVDWVRQVKAQLILWSSEVKKRLPHIQHQIRCFCIWQFNSHQHAITTHGRGVLSAQAKKQIFSPNRLFQHNLVLWLWPWIGEVIKMRPLGHFILIPDAFAVLLHNGSATLFVFIPRRCSRRTDMSRAQLCYGLRFLKKQDNCSGDLSLTQADNVKLDVICKKLRPGDLLPHLHCLERAKRTAPGDNARTQDPPSIIR